MHGYRCAANERGVRQMWEDVEMDRLIQVIEGDPVLQTLPRR